MSAAEVRLAQYGPLNTDERRREFLSSIPHRHATHVLLEFNALGDDGARQVLPPLLELCPHLQELAVVTNLIAAHGAAAIIPHLVGHAALTSVLLTNNPLGDEAGTAPLGLLLSPRLVTLDLQGCNLHVANCVALASALATNSTLATLNLSFNGALGSRGVDALADALASNGTLRHLNLSTCELRSAGKLGTTKLWHLDLSGNDLPGSAVAELCASLGDNTSLRHLNLADNTALDSSCCLCFADLLARNATLSTLILHEVALLDPASTTAFAAFATALGANKSLTRLNLNGALLGGDASVANLLARALARNPVLLSLDLGASEFDVEAMRSLCSAGLLPNRTLRDLNLSGTAITKEVVAVLAPALHNHPMLVELRLNDCGIDDEALVTLVAALSAPKSAVTELALSQNAICDQGGRAMAAWLAAPTCLLKALEFEGWDSTDGAFSALVQSLSLNASLRTLSLFGTPIPSAGVWESLGSALQQNTTLHHLTLDPSAPFNADASGQENDNEEHDDSDGECPRWYAPAVCACLDAWDAGSTALFECNLIEFLDLYSPPPLQRRLQQLETRVLRRNRIFWAAKPSALALIMTASAASRRQQQFRRLPVEIWDFIAHHFLWTGS